jgi:uncharacterized membrane protein YdfJ with MMPL/SSD domain
MNSDDKQQTEDVQVETALRNFRESVHTWSEAEYARPRSVPASRRSGLWFMHHRFAAWGLASAIAITAVGVPTGMHVHYEQQLKAKQQAAAEAEAKREFAERQAALQVNDEELLINVDQDIAQAAPDAMEPLASLMSDSAN